VSRLTWIERDHGWRAGPYEIELAAPELWVCTRRLRNGRIKVETTSGSLKALKGSVEMRDARRRRLQQSLMYLGAFSLAMAVVAVAAAAGWALAPLLIVIFSSIGLLAVIKAVDCIVQRSWEAVRLHYQ
jgi:hypothetical protein